LLIDGRNAINDNSIAFMLQYKRFRMLFTGDAGSTAERRFLDEGITICSGIPLRRRLKHCNDSARTFIEQMKTAVSSL